MKHTEQEITGKLKQILKDLDGEFYSEQLIRKVVFNPDTEVSVGKNAGKKIPCWVVAIDEIFDSSRFLIISDETGEPLYIRGKHSVYEIRKDKNGKYF